MAGCSSWGTRPPLVTTSPVDTGQQSSGLHDMAYPSNLPCSSIYISGDALTIDELEEFPGRWACAGKPIDLMLVRLEGTAIPGHSVPLLLATMDAMQGIELIQLVQSGITIPAHDQYVVSPF